MFGSAGWVDCQKIVNTMLIKITKNNLALKIGWVHNETGPIVQARAMKAAWPCHYYCGTTMCKK